MKLFKYRAADRAGFCIHTVEHIKADDEVLGEGEVGDELWDEYSRAWWELHKIHARLDAQIQEWHDAGDD